jgi:outer membrane receptor for ferrienterochelin and colicins
MKKLSLFSTTLLILLSLGTALGSQENPSDVSDEILNTEDSADHETPLDQDAFSAGEIVITGTRTKRRISDSPVLTQTVNEEQIRENAYLDVGEALEDVPGLYVQDDAVGGGYLKSLSIQGMDKRRILVLIDGNPTFGSYAGRMNMATFGVGGIERIEVVKGPSSSLYGSGAIGGVVNIITKKAQKPIGYSTSLVYKADPHWNSSITWSHRFSLNRSGTSAALNLAMNTSDGYYLQDDDENSANTPLQVGYDIGGEIMRALTPSLSLNANGQFTLRQTQRWGLNLSSVNNVDISRYSVCPALEYSIGDKIALNLSFYATRYEHEKYQTYVEYADRIKEFEALESRPFEAVKSLTGFDKSEEESGNRRQNEKLTRLDFMANGENGRLLWVTGANAGRMNFETDNISGGPKERDEQSLFGQAEWRFTPETSLIAGSRYEHSNAYGSDFSPKIAVMTRKNNVLKEQDSLLLRASVAKGYRAPDFKELYYELPYSTKGMAIIGGEYLREFATWEPRLKPEKSVGFNVGPEYFWRNNLHVQVNVFWNELWDALSFTAFDKSSETYAKMVEIFPKGSAAGNVTDETNSDYAKTVTNIERVRALGVESYLSTKAHGWHGTVSHTHTQARDVTNDVRLKNKPSDILKLSLKRLVVFGDEWHGDEEQPGAYRLDAHLSLNLGEKYVFTVGIENITNERSIQYLNQLPGRMFYVTNNFSF